MKWNMFSPLSLPVTVAGRLETLTNWYLGQELLDEHGHPTGERGPPLISKELYIRLLKATEQMSLHFSC